MKVKTSNLIGEPLNYAVGVIEYGLKKVFIDPTPKRKGIWVIPENGGGKSHFHPAKSWAQGGRIIERENISLVKVDRGEPVWSAYPYLQDPEEVLRIRKSGHTALIAAMRCYVASKVGDEVEIPERLL